MDELCRLPYEIKLKILSYLKSGDLLQLAETSKSWEQVVFDRDLIRNVCFYNDYRLNDQLVRFTLPKARAECVISLNINSCYWIRVDMLRKCIGRLIMLERLYVIDTQLTLDIRNLVHINKLQRLQRLGISYKDRCNCETLHLPKSIKALALVFRNVVNYTFLRQLVNLEDLWVEISSPGQVSVLEYLPKSIKKITINSFVNRILFIEVTDPETFNILPFNINDPLVCNVVSVLREHYKNVICKEVKYGSYPELDILINTVRCVPLFGYRDCLTLIKENVKDPRWEELNFWRGHVCSQIMKDSVRSILRSSNVNSLRKLCLPSCLIIEGNAPSVPSYNETPPKRVRIDLPSLCPDKSMLEDISEYLAKLEELEIIECGLNKWPSNVRNVTLRSIANFVNLKKLTVHDVPNRVNCEFLVDVCMECKSLVSLKIGSSYASHFTMTQHLCTALRYTTTLQELCHQNPSLPFDKLLETLANLPNLSLAHLVLIGKGLKFDCKLLDMLLTKKTLTVFCLFMKNLTVPEIKNIRCLFKQRKLFDWQVFIVDKKLKEFGPSVHYSRGDHLLAGVVNVCDSFR